MLFTFLKSNQIKSHLFVSVASIARFHVRTFHVLKLNDDDEEDQDHRK